jgi:hypothetical protein
MTHDLIERERPLAICPVLACRRSGTCRNHEAGLACHRTHESLDDFRDRLAAKLWRIAVASGADPARLAGDCPLDDDVVEQRLAAFKRALEQRERELA